MLLYLLKHSRLDLLNSVRELTKVMDGATSGHMKALIRVIKYVEKTKDYELVLDPGQETKWEMCCELLLINHHCGLTHVWTSE